jgi:hypothetical protein
MTAAWHAGHADGTFTLMDTLRWRHQSWSHAKSGAIVGAEWSTKASPPMVVLVCTLQLIVVYLTEDAPSLSTQLAPLSAPQLFNRAEVSSAAHHGTSSLLGGTVRTRCVCVCVIYNQGHITLRAYNDRLPPTGPRPSNPRPP